MCRFVQRDGTQKEHKTWCFKSKSPNFMPLFCSLAFYSSSRTFCLWLSFSKAGFWRALLRWPGSQLRSWVDVFFLHWLSEFEGQDRLASAHETSFPPLDGWDSRFPSCTSRFVTSTRHDYDYSPVRKVRKCFPGTTLPRCFFPAGPFRREAEVRSNDRCPSCLVVQWPCMTILYSHYIINL